MKNKIKSGKGAVSREWLHIYDLSYNLTHAVHNERIGATLLPDCGSDYRLEHRSSRVNRPCHPSG